ncbi:MAG TPA: DUF4118 domain-containing protein, partial [Methylocystis sp.]|nr:DUF4118 domain-containing protein [Methylocystis sp.]
MSAGETNAEGASRLFGRLHQRPALATRLFIAIATSIFAIYARLWLGDEFGVTPTYITFYPAVVIISFLCGFHFGLLSLLMFFIASDYYLFEPKSTFKLPLTSDMIGLFIFSTTCLAISGGSELMYRAQQKIVGNERRLRDQSSSEAALSLQALRENEERLRLFVEHAPAAVAMFDKDMRCLAASRRWMDDYGLEGPIGRSQFDVFPKLPERWKAVHRRVLAGVSLSAEDDRVEKLDGTAQYLRWEALPW